MDLLIARRTSNRKVFTSGIVLLLLLTLLACGDATRTPTASPTKAVPRINASQPETWPQMETPITAENAAHLSLLAEWPQADKIAYLAWAPANIASEDELLLVSTDEAFTIHRIPPFETTVTNDIGAIKDAVFLVDGKRLLWNVGNTIILTDIQSGKPIQTWELDCDEEQEPVVGMALLGDAKTVLVAYENDSSGIRSFSLDTATLCVRPSILGDQWTGARYPSTFVTGPNGEVAIGALKHATVGIWVSESNDVALQQFLRAEDEENGITALAFTADGMRLAAAANENVYLWLREDGTLLNTFAAGGEVTAVAFSPDGALLAMTLANGTLQLWDAEAEFTQHYAQQVDKKALVTVAFAPDGTLLLTGGVNEVVKVWGIAGK